MHDLMCPSVLFELALLPCLFVVVAVLSVMMLRTRFRLFLIVKLCRKFEFVRCLEVDNI
jgi:hypothetical protein